MPAFVCNICAMHNTINVANSPLLLIKCFRSEKMTMAVGSSLQSIT